MYFIKCLEVYIRQKNATVYFKDKPCPSDQVFSCDRMVLLLLSCSPLCPLPVPSTSHVAAEMLQKCKQCLGPEIHADRKQVQRAQRHSRARTLMEKRQGIEKETN